MKDKVNEMNDNWLCARITEEPIAGKPHDGICEGDAG